MWNHSLRPFRRSAVGLIALGAILATLPAWGCSVPVFRYALEHWSPDVYQAVVFHRGKLAAEAQAAIAPFTPSISDPAPGGTDIARSHANFSLQTIDLNENSAREVLEFWQHLGADSMPWVVLRYPSTTGLPGNIWSGPLSETAIRQLTESPARREIASRLGRGESAVWVLLEMGDAAKDNAAAELITSRLNYLTNVLELPQLEAEDIANGLVSVGQDDLKLAFSVLRLSRTDPDEQVFIKMLLGTEADLVDLNEPMAFPIFGRGRALYALVGNGINHATIDEAATFLIGKCSCQVKELNPGVDLLFTADWDSIIKPEVPPAQQAAAAIPPTEPAPETVTISGDTGELEPGGAASHSTTDSPVVTLGLVLAGLAVVSGLLLLFRRL